MTERQELRRTPLHDAHVSSNARLVPFAGWEMPVQFSGVIDEHMAVRERAGLFDVSHMGEAWIKGPQALDFLQWVTCNDVGKLKVGRAHYNGLTLPNGAFVDDLIVYRVEETAYLLVLNATRTAADLAWLHDHVDGREVAIEDASDDWALLALQGPEAVEILAPLAVTDVSGMRRYSVARTRIDDIECIVSRTGYTGEDGFEVFSPPGHAARLWRAILASGESHGAVPVGLGARDTLRLEAKMALYGNDIDETTTVLEADLGWIAKLDKGEFIGREALSRQRQRGVRRKLVGFEMKGRAVARRGYPVLRDGDRVSTVTSGSYAPYLGKNIGLAYLPPETWAPGSTLEVEIRGRPEAAVVVPTPFYKRPRR